MNFLKTALVFTFVLGAQSASADNANEINQFVLKHSSEVGVGSYIKSSPLQAATQVACSVFGGSEFGISSETKFNISVKANHSGSYEYVHGVYLQDWSASVKSSTSKYDKYTLTQNVEGATRVQTIQISKNSIVVMFPTQFQGGTTRFSCIFKPQ